MAIQLSVALRNARLDVIESTIGTSPSLEIRTGAAPASCAAADSGTVVSTVVMPADWAAAASGGSKALSGTWQDAAADATGTAAHFRIKQGATCHMQGTVTITAGGGDLQVDNTSFATGQTFTVTAFTLTEPNG